MSGLQLQQDAPVMFSEFETKVLPAVNDAFGPDYTAHLLNRMEGGIYFSVRAGKKLDNDGFNVRFDFADWGAQFGVDKTLPHYEKPGPLEPLNSTWVHALHYKDYPVAKWTPKEKQTMESVLVQVLQWRPLYSPGYTKALTVYDKPSNYSYVDQLPDKVRQYWKNKRVKASLRRTFIKRPRTLRHLHKTK